MILCIQKKKAEREDLALEIYVYVFIISYMHTLISNRKIHIGIWYYCFLVF